MRKVLIIITTSLFALSLSACASTYKVHHEIGATNENVEQQTEAIFETTKDIAKEAMSGPTEEPAKEVLKTDDKIIDFTFTQAINSALAPFTFQILGESFGTTPYEDMLRVKVDSIYVSDARDELMQEIKVDAWPRSASEDNRYGLEFNDYNFDAYLDISIRRFPGEGSNNRTHYYWLWDNEAQQFAYDWKLSEMITDENLIDFTVTQSVHDDLNPLSIRLLGRLIEGWSSDIQDMADNVDANIHVIQVMDSDGVIIQEFDRLDAVPPYQSPSYGLHFADYNFDGYLDMALFMYRGGTMHNEPHKYWLWDNASKLFLENEELSEISNTSTISINTEENRLACYTRIGSGSGITQHFKYIDGEYIFVYSIEWGLNPSPDKEGEYVRYEIINELIDGKIMISKNYYDDLDK